MLPRNPIARFLCVFVLLYVLLVLPWPGWGRIYGGCFRSLGSALFAGESGLRELSFEPLGDERRPSALRIVIVNRNMIHADQSGPVRNLDVDALDVGWKPTALLIALVIATPVSWRRRGWALLWGLLSIHVIIFLFLGFTIWNESTEVSLVTLSPFWKQFADGLKDLLLWQYSLVIPAVVWVLVTFRKEDRAGAIGVSLFGPVAGGGNDAPEKAATDSRKQGGK